MGGRRSEQRDAWWQLGEDRAWVIYRARSAAAGRGLHRKVRLGQADGVPPKPPCSVAGSKRPSRTLPTLTAVRTVAALMTFSRDAVARGLMRKIQQPQARFRSSGGDFRKPEIADPLPGSYGDTAPDLGFKVLRRRTEGQWGRLEVSVKFHNIGSGSSKTRQAQAKTTSTRPGHPLP